MSDGSTGPTMCISPPQMRRTVGLVGVRAVSVALLGGLSIAVLAACSHNDDHATSSKAEDVSPTSVPSTSMPAGSTRELALPGPGVTDLVVSGQSEAPSIAGLSGGKMVVGSVSAWTDGTPTVVDLADNCQDLSRAADGGYSVACQDHVLVFDEHGIKTRDIHLDGTATTAVVTKDVASVTLAGEKKVKYFSLKDTDQGGETTVPIGEGAAQSLLVDPDASSGKTKEMAAIFDKKQSSLTGVYPGENKQGSSLRIGQGAGKIAGGQNGVVVASSTALDSLEVFTADDILRKHQTIHTDSTPWGVAWDAATRTVWVTSTGKNTVTGYDISSGVPIKVATMSTIADAQSVVVDSDGGLLIASPQSLIVQHVPKEQIDKARSDASHKSSYAVKKES